MTENATIESWTEDESATYRALSAVAVPERERQIAIMVDLVRAAEVPGPVLEICCGEGLWTEALLGALPGVTVHAYDGSPSMLEATRQRCGAPQRLVTREIDIAEDGWRRFDAPLRAAVSSLAVHHLDGPGKQALFADLFAALAPGGVFVLADVIRPANRTGDRLAARMWDEETERRAGDLGTPEGLAAFHEDGWNHFHREAPDPVDKPSRVSEHFDWLRAAGFGDVDLHWMLAGQAMMSAWKPV